MIRRVLGIGALAALVLAGIALFEPGPDTAPAGLTTPEGSDYYMRSARLTQFAADGSLHYRIRADESLHFPDDSAEFTGIDVHYLAAGRGLWTLRADRGHTPAGSQDILLTGGVRLTHNPDSPRPLQVDTARAWLRSEAGRAETEARVTARSPARRARGNGMTLVFDRETLTLHHDVQVIYKP